MISTLSFFKYLAVMALVTYSVRMIPLMLCKQKIKNRFIRSFLFYMPYAVLGAMTFPAILYSTGDMYTALAGCIAALIFSWLGKGLLTVAACTSITVLLADIIRLYILN
ncbi:MAG: AzlD domain-containing protein [Bacteroides sp.]|nr:AzlD domain-containing protein [Prevotella sp.]MCM1407715.1 AzlD domain-containing protein [Treponema brennaborense]MCM1469135.1 AzlD domain-containing protein [Bacteroides sp.]